MMLTMLLSHHLVLMERNSSRQLRRTAIDEL